MLHIVVYTTIYRSVHYELTCLQVIAPIQFIIFIAYLRPGGESNKIVKYADNAILLVPEKTDVQINYEFDKVVVWASKSKLGINIAKPKKIIFHRPYPKNLLLPATLPVIETVLSAKLLGVWLQYDLEMGIHVDNIIAKICNNDYIY